MNRALLITGLAKIGFGVLVGAFGIFIALRLLQRLLKTSDADGEIARGNIAVGIVESASLVSLGLLAQQAVSATFEAMDLLYRGQRFSMTMFVRFWVYAIVHVGAALVVGALVLGLGVRVFERLTRGVDELAEVRRGNVASALVVAGMIVVMSLMAAPGLRAVLDGLLPIPELPRDVLTMPS
ncbi:MAG: DUF350 domain-containing protein [Polyangiales bacterium]